MIAAIIVLLALHVVVACAIGGNLGRIARALEAQNSHFGIDGESERAP